MANSIAERDALSTVLHDTHGRNLVAYKRLLEPDTKFATGEHVPFWDIVVVTAGDYQQRRVYERRIHQKLEQGGIPSRAKYHVIDDPPGAKIGSGGSTFFVMRVLSELYSGEFLAEARVLLIHAGGYSTRLPHVSARGKVFTTLPQADSLEGIQVLDLKLVLYLHLLEFMPPGVFLTSADGIELFASQSPFPQELKPYTITALAHPSSTRIGSTHGVYLLQDPEGRAAADRKMPPAEQCAMLLTCERFLHKPSLDVMKGTPNVIHGDVLVSAEPIVYTDSCYYFDPRTASVMAEVYPTLPDECDLEAWADILSFQGQSLEASTFSSNSSVTTDTPHTMGRRIVQQAFDSAGVSLDVMVLNASKFYHIGTMEEFIDSVCTDQLFMSELNIRNDVEGIALVVSLPPVETIYQASRTGFDGLRPPAFIENSHVASVEFVDTQCIIVDSDLPERAAIPRGTCLFTLQLQDHEFVTFTFSVKDDMKKSTVASSNEALHELLTFERVPMSAVVGRSADSSRPACSGRLSLWTAPVFEVAQTKHGSVGLALRRLDRIRHYLASGQEAIGDELATADVVGWCSLAAAARGAREYSAK